jgi:tetratricopeptide (TPR) repeat protein
MDYHDLQDAWKKGEVLLDRFRIEDLMYGGMGFVYKVKDLKGSGFKAVKTYHNKYLWNRKVVENFLEEANTWIRLGRHANIVEAMFVQEVRGRPCVFIEFVEGEDLSTLISHRRLTLRLSIAFAIQFCRGMIYAQQVIPGIVHRDIKPGNTLVEMNGLLKITDWGLAKTAPEARVKLLGTLPYMPPEQFKDASSVDTRSDIYSFGVMFYQMLTNRLPFTPKGYPTLQDWRRLHSEVHPTPLREYMSDVPPEIETLVHTCLEKLPVDRPQSFEIIMTQLQDVYKKLYGERIDIIEQPVSEYERLCNKAASFNSLHQFEDAVTVCKEAISLKGDIPAAWINLGIALEGLDRNEEALESYDRAVRIDPSERITWNNRGNALHALERFDEACVSYDRALELDPGYERAWNNKGWLLLDSLQRYQDALRCFDEAVRIDPNYVDAWNNRAITLWRLGKSEEAIESLDTALAINPTHVKGLGNYSGYLAGVGRYEEAVELCKRALLVNPQSYQALNHMGIALRYLQRPEEALMYWERAVDSPEEYAPHEALSNMGDLLCEMGQLDKAIQYQKEALQKNPKSSIYYARLGLALHKSQNRLAAKESYEQAVILDCPDPVMFYNYALLLCELGEYEIATEQFREAIKRQHEFPEAYNNLGGTLHKMGRFEEAIEAYNKCLALQPNHAQAHNNLGLALVKLNRYSEAMTAHRKAVELKSDYGEGWRNLGILQMQMEKMNDACTSFQAAVEIDPTDYRSWTNLSAIALFQDDPKTAADCAKKALSIKPDFLVAENNLKIAKERLINSGSDKKQEKISMDTKENDSSNLKKVSVNPKEVVSIKVAIMEGERFPNIGCTEFARQTYQALNQQLYAAIEQLGRWEEIKIDCQICPSSYDHGMFGFAVAVGQQEVKNGYSALVQNDIEFAYTAIDAKLPSKVTFITVVDYTNRKENPAVGFVIGGPLAVEH